MPRKKIDIRIGISKEALIRLRKCDDYPPPRIEAFIGDLPFITLSNMLEAKIPLEAKIWCINNLKLLDDLQIHQLACDFAYHALEQNSLLPESAMLTEVLNIVRTCWRESPEYDALNEKKTMLNLLKQEASFQEKKTMAVLESIIATTGKDAITALMNAGSCARAAVGDEHWDREAEWQIQRTKELIRQYPTKVETF